MLFNEIKEYSKLIEEEIINDEFEYEYFNDEDLDDRKSYFYSYSQNDNENNFDNFKKFEIFCYIKLNKENEYNFTIQSDLFNIQTQYIYELIKNIVKEFNKNEFEIKYNSNNYILILKDSENENDLDFYINNYELRPYKKRTLKPKFDLPNYCAKSLLYNIKNEVICFIPKDPINILLYEKFDNIEQENKCFEENNYNDYIFQNQNIVVNNESKKRQKIKKSNKLLWKNNCIIL